MKKILIVLLAAVAAFSFSELKADNTGCGFGTTLMKGKNGKLMEILAVTTNGTSASQTFAISTGTSGYKAGATIGKNLVDEYVAQNMDNLATDIAKGEGEYVDTLAHLMKVENKPEFRKTLKNNFNKIYTSDSIESKEVVSNIKKVVS